MIDGGVLASHPALERASITQQTFPEGSAVVPSDHGTAVAGRLTDTMARAFDLLVADVLRTGDTWTGADALAKGLAWLTV